MTLEEFDNLKFKATERYVAWGYDKGFNKITQDWFIVSDAITHPKIIKTGLTEAEADAFLKLLRS